MVIRYSTLELNDPQELKLDWSRSGKKNASSMHSIASYLAMFAPAVPDYFIKRYTQEGDTVMDPFSGRGTTALEARTLGRNFVGSDLNPYALVLSKAKIARLNKSSLIKRINEIENNYLDWRRRNINITRRAKYRELSIYYAPEILRQLIFFKDVFINNWRKLNKVDNGIVAFLLGIMHGPMKKDGTSTFLSLSMSNSISMSPNYVKNYAIKHGLKKPTASVFNRLIARINTKYDDIIGDEFDAKLYEADATKNNRKIANDSVDLVVTSPPYLSIVNYTNTNWIKLWLLGYERQSLKKDIALSDRLKFDEYIVFITNVLNSLESKLRRGGKVCLIVGDVHGTKLIEQVWRRISDNVNYDLVEIFYDNGYKQSKKVLNTMNERKGKATTVEKVLVVEKR